jgi:hypothetical protein
LSNHSDNIIQLMTLMRWIQGFINTGTLYLSRPDGRGKYIILGLINPGIHRIESH